MPAITALNVLSSLTSLLLIITTIVLYITFQLRKKYSYWKRRGAPCLEPDSLFFGNTKDLIFERESVCFVLKRIYDELEGHAFGGFFQLTKPVLMIRDPQLIRNCFVQNFAHFQDRNRVVDEALDPLSSHLMNLTGERWKNVRNKLTQTFSPSKVKAMGDLMQECVSDLADYLGEATRGEAADSGVEDVRELMAKFAIDVIGSCAFGLSCRSITHGDSEFRRIGRLVFTPSKKTHLRNFLRLVAPKLNALLKLKANRPEVEDFFFSVLKDAIKYRESNARKRNDFLQLLIDIQTEEIKQHQSEKSQRNGIQNGAQNGIQNGHTDNSAETQKDILFTDTIVASNAFLFLIAGFETTASALSYCLYELALNPDICRKMRDEVESVRRSHNGHLDHDAMKDLVYVDAVISETLRKYPPATALVRRCTERFEIPGTSVVVEEGTLAFVSVYGLHHDPKYFPEPEKFDPERFSEKNKDSIIPGSYVPFGDGPRICIGKRFAQYEMVAVLSYIVSNYTIHTCEKTPMPLKYDPRSTLLLTPIGGVWVQFKKIAKP